MKNTNLLYIAAGCMALLAGCSDDELVNQTQPWQPGDGICFNARAGFENNSKDQRTVYTGETYDYNGKKYEKINWVNGDRIRVFCPQAVNPAQGQGVGSAWSDYTIQANSTNGNPGVTTNTTNYYGTMSPADPKGSLQWGSKTETHKFYAVYPAPDAAKNNTVKINRNMVEGTIPGNQAPKSITKGNNSSVYVCEPNMDYAYMTATTEVSPGQSNAVNLSFQSIATAVEFELKKNPENTEPIHLSAVQLSSNTHNINGGFTCDLDKFTTDGYPTCGLTQSTEARNIINYSLLIKDNNGQPLPLTLNNGESVKFTVFMLPVTDLSDIDLTIVTPSGRATHKLVQGTGTSATPVTFKAHRKHLFQNISLPKSKITADKWVGSLMDNVLFSQLSIPGTGNSFSYTYGGNEPHYYKEQTLYIKDQWNLGIRCFEITSDRLSDENGSLGNCQLRINASKNGEINTTVAEAVDSIYDQVKANPTDFAVVILSYQPSIGRDHTVYLKNFVNYYNSLTFKQNIVELSPKLTVKDVRGKLMFVLRPTSDGEDSMLDTDWALVQNIPALVVDGWGSLKDKWKQRGYPVSTQTMESKILKNFKDAPAESAFSPLKKGTANYTYTSNKSHQAWIQEWPRVVENNVVVRVKDNWIKPDQWAFWPESYTEKLADAKATFDKAIADKDNTSMIYVNSLCGFFIDPTNVETCKPVGTDGLEYGSSYGNIEKFANRINGEFYQYVYDKGTQITGPMGIVLMSRVGNTQVSGSMLMPNMVLQNNFKFPLLTGGSNQPVQTNGNAYGNGGAAIQ